MCKGGGREQHGHRTKAEHKEGSESRTLEWTLQCQMLFRKVAAGMVSGCVLQMQNPGACIWTEVVGCWTTRNCLGLNSCADGLISTVVMFEQP